MEETRLALLSGWNEASLRLLQVVKIDSRTVSGQMLASLRLLAHLQYVESPECTTTSTLHSGTCKAASSDGSQVQKDKAGRGATTPHPHVGPLFLCLDQQVSSAHGEI